MALFYINGLSEIVDQYERFIIDLWGVIHDGVHVYPYATHCLEEIRKKGKEIYFLSNSPRRASLIMEQLDHLGISKDLYQYLYTSGEDTYETIQNKSNAFYRNLGVKVYPLSLQMHSQLFEDLDLILVHDLNEASYIINTGPTMSQSHDYDEILQKAHTLQLPMICVNPDISVISGGKVTLCAGTLAKRYESLGGIVKYHGKPYPEIYTNLLKKMGTPPLEKILAIGDSLSTDIKGANTMNIDSALVMTGLSEHEFGIHEAARERLSQSTQQKDIHPKYVLPSFIF